MHTQQGLNRPFTSGKLSNSPAGIYICNDYWYDENGKKHFVPNRKKRRLLASQNQKPKRTNNRKHTNGRFIQVIDGKQIAHSY